MCPAPFALLCAVKPMSMGNPCIPGAYSPRQSAEIPVSGGPADVTWLQVTRGQGKRWTQEWQLAPLHTPFGDR